jgi:hypothetical protein
VDTQAISPPQHHRHFLERFVAACRADERVVAAFQGGSYARSAADAHSDLDLTVITTDAAYAGFVAAREAFVRQLGELVFLEDFGLPHIVFSIFADGTEAELWFASESRTDHIHCEPYRVLLDKKGILAGAVFPEQPPTHAGQVELLRRLVAWFWHDLSHFITAMARGQLWWAHGQLEVLRRLCVGLARLRHNFADPDAEDDPYFKVERALPAEQLAPLQATYVPLEREAMLQAARIILRFYQELAQPLARAHGIPYPTQLERVMVARLEQVSGERVRETPSP